MVGKGLINNAHSGRSHSNACRGQSTKYSQHAMTSQSSRVFSRNPGSLGDVTSVTHARTHAHTDRTNVKVLTSLLLETDRGTSMYGMCACYSLACHLLQSRQKTAAKEKEKTETARALEAMERVSHGGGGGGGGGAGVTLSLTADTVCMHTEISQISS